MTRTARTVLTALVASSLLLAGCTVGGDDPDDGASDGTAGGPVVSEEPGDDADALSSEDISDQLLDEGEALAAREPLATVEAELPVSPAAAVLTLDIIEVVATPSGTVVDMAVTAPGPVNAQNATFSSLEFVNPEYLSDIDLVDRQAQETLRPVQAAEGGRWCQCSKTPTSLSSVPTPLSAVFPAIDEATTTVDIRFGNFPVVEGVPVTR